MPASACLMHGCLYAPGRPHRGRRHGAAAWQCGSSRRASLHLSVLRHDERGGDFLRKVPRPGSGGGERGIGMTPAGLRTLYDKYKAEGFQTIAFPCNQFGGQAPGTDEEERAWAIRKFGFEFDVYDKVLVNGPSAHPLYRFLKAQQPLAAPGAAQPGRPQGDVAWNYEKFLVDRSGQAVKRFKSALDPLSFEADVRLLLAGKGPLPAECIMHPGRKVCNVDKLLAV
ncbi:thioredoxin-like protein [Haematococcus lacustris]